MALGLEGNDLQLVLETTAFILEQVSDFGYGCLLLCGNMPFSKPAIATADAVNLRHRLSFIDK